MSLSSSSRSRLWRGICFGVLVYEIAAMASKGRIPYITHVVRGLPRPARIAVTMVIAAVVHDHFDTQRLF